jgi:hypothetical protein
MKRKTGRARSTLMPLPSLQAEQPPAIQIASRKVMKSAWVDPDDTTPGAAKTARQIHGHRRFDPLRWCLHRHRERSSFSEEHIMAADLLRAAWDGSRLGFVGLKTWMPVQSAVYRPSTGPAGPALRQLRARQTFDGAWRLCCGHDRALLLAVVLGNMSLGKAADRLRVSKPWATQALVLVLDRLCEHFEISEPRRRAA